MLVLEKPAKSEAAKPDKNSVIAYVDGSFRADTGEFSLWDGDPGRWRGKCFCQKMTDQELALMHNVAGEIKGSEAAMQYALDHEIPEIVIYHDYEGIAKWCTGAWKANKEGNQGVSGFLSGSFQKGQSPFCKGEGPF